MGKDMSTVDDQLKLLFDYTKFHIGMYITLVAAIIGVFANNTLKSVFKLRSLHDSRYFMLSSSWYSRWASRKQHSLLYIG